jgi:hypothetical protein
MALYLDKIEKRAGSKVRLTYSIAPKAASAAGANDALNPANYAIGGPGYNYVVSVSPVSGLPTAFDLTLYADVTVGTWRFYAGNVQTDSGTPLSAKG